MDDFGATHRGGHRCSHRSLRGHRRFPRDCSTRAFEESGARRRALELHIEWVPRPCRALCDRAGILEKQFFPQEHRLSASDQEAGLKRVLGRWDLVLLFVVAVFNLNVVPSIAANGGVTLWLWIVSLVLFFWPQGIAVIELAHRFPGEGGVYLWAKEVFGDFHGFLSGWCYWTNNMLYVPTVMLYFVGVSVFALGPGHAG